ncbi:MAG TPA: methyltransferase domain-containing protein, partial [candidate division CPR3 bacterium]|nr:methyltransferase domain-containing protein [candidate division CPR3 bacterium]
MKEASESYGLTFQMDPLQAGPILKKLNVRPGERVLEIGCNRGRLLKKLQKQNIDAIGIDVNEKAVQKKVVDEVYLMDAENLEFEDESFDKIYSVHTIEHIPNLKKAIGEMDRVLKPGGRIVLIYPATSSPAPSSTEVLMEWGIRSLHALILCLQYTLVS